MIPLHRYTKIRNRYCVAYFGQCDEYILQLMHARPFFERAFPGLELYIACRDEAFRIATGQPRIVQKSEMADRCNDFPMIRELKYNFRSHPVQEFVEESGVVIDTLPLEKDHTTKCVIWAGGTHPTGNMPDNLILEWRTRATKLGYRVEVGGDVSNAGWVIGVESVPLYRAAIRNVKTTLIDTGIGGGF